MLLPLSSLLTSSWALGPRLLGSRSARINKLRVSKARLLTNEQDLHVHFHCCYCCCWQKTKMLPRVLEGGGHALHIRRRKSQCLQYWYSFDDVISSSMMYIGSLVPPAHFAQHILSVSSASSTEAAQRAQAALINSSPQ